MRTAAIILAAGKGTRLKSRTVKPLIALAGKPLVAYSIGVFDRHPGIDDIVVVVSPQARPGVMRLLAKGRYRKICAVVRGGKERQDSVRCGLQALRALRICADLVAVHDSARPFVTEPLISELLAEAKRFGAAIPAVPVKATIKLVRQRAKVRSRFVERTVERSRLWEVQTPQVFRRALLEEGFARFGVHPVTDDAMLVEKMGRPVAVVEGSYRNIKVTSPEDVLAARALLRSI
jgi:2-C-methyl-D-erythritol 4-phosphate cytidylyltransferase